MVLAQLAFIPPIKVNLIFKYIRYLTSAEPHPATFPLDICSLSTIFLLLPFLMSDTLCHLSQPYRERSQAAKTEHSSHFHLQWWWADHDQLFIIAHSVWHCDDTVRHCLDSYEKVLFIKVTSHLVEHAYNIKTIHFYVASSLISLHCCQN